MFFSLTLLASSAKFAGPSFDVSEEFRLHLISTVINDLASVLGFAILYSAYYDNPKLSEAALGKFASQIERESNQQQYLKNMIIISNPHSISWTASPRGSIRFKWLRAFRRRTTQDGYGGQMNYGRGKAHTSKIVNEFLSSHSDASHLFFATQVLLQIEIIDFKIDNRITRLADLIEEETSE